MRGSALMWRPQTRCIVLVNNGQQSQIANAHGADAVLAKGFTVTTLTATVAKLYL